VQKKAVVFPTDAMIYPKMRLISLSKMYNCGKIISWLLEFVQELQFSGRVTPLSHVA